MFIPCEHSGSKPPKVVEDASYEFQKLVTRSFSLSKFLQILITFPDLSSEIAGILISVEREETNVLRIPFESLDGQVTQFKK